MTKCKRCKINIPEGTEYCEDCRDKVKANVDESYLDSLLNSVKNTMPSAENIYKKKSATANLSQATTKEFVATEASKPWDTEAFEVDPSDLDDFSKLMLEEDFKDNIVIKDEELFGSDLTSIFDDASSELDGPEPSRLDEKAPFGNQEYEAFTELMEEEASAVDTEVLTLLKESSNPLSFDEDKTNINEYSSTTEEDRNEYTSFLGDDINELLSSAEVDMDEIPSDLGEAVNIASSLGEQNYDDIQNLTEETHDDINELLNNLDFSFNNADDTDLITEEDINQVTENLAAVTQDTYDQPSINDQDALNQISNNQDLELTLEGGLQFAREEELEQLEADDDFMELFNQISADDPVADDMKAISNMLQGKPIIPESNMPSDVGEVFSDALKAVSSLNDYDIDEAELLNGVPDASKNKKKRPKKKSGKDKKSHKNQAETTGEPKPKVSIWQRLFRNVELDEDKKEPKPVGTASSEAKTGKAGKKKGSKKQKGASDAEVEDLSDNPKGKGKAEADKAAADKKQAKKEKKEKKKKDKEIIQVIDEIDEDEGRINRLGAFIVFLFFGLLVLLLLAGSNVISYTLSIQNATNYFEKQKYTEAYNEVYGVDIKDEDLEIYDKIMTVMFVNKQLNSYNNYYSIQKYPEALDSLLKGLKRYDKYIELATLLGIESDLNYVRAQILAELQNVFNLSEKEAMAMNAYVSMEEYSKQVYDVVLERMDY